MNNGFGRVMRLWTILLLLVCLCAPALAQQLPDAARFSSGIERWNDALREGKPLTAEFTASAEKAFYIRDLSVLSAILKDSVIRYEADGSWEEGSDRLTLLNDGEPLLTAALFRTGGRTALQIGDRVIALPSDPLLQGIPSELTELSQPVWTLLGSLTGPAVLNRIPLPEFEAALLALPASLTGGEPFVTAQTWSDDGLRFTRLDLSGQLLLGEGDFCRIEGYIRTPGGREPKDTAKITIVNETAGTDLLLEVSSLRKASVTKKNAAGQTEVNTTVKLSGKWHGNTLLTRLIVSEQNTWTVSEGKLREKLLVVVTLGHTDKTPGRRKLRLNDLSGKFVLSGTLVSFEDGDSSFDGKLTADLDMDGNDTLTGVLNMKLKAGGEPRKTAFGELPEATELREVSEALEQVIPELASKLYAKLPQNIKDKIGQGL